MKANEIALGVLFVLIAYELMSKPNCNKGCKTVAEHLLTHGLDDLAAGLLA